MILNESPMILNELPMILNEPPMILNGFEEAAYDFERNLVPVREPLMLLGLSSEIYCLYFHYNYPTSSDVGTSAPLMLDTICMTFDHTLL